jgi:hypothetical protein
VIKKRRVLIQLDAVWPHPTDARQTAVSDGLDLARTVPGALVLDSWVRSARGMWLARCSFEIPYVDPTPHRRGAYAVTDQLVPAHALQRLD